MVKRLLSMVLACLLAICCVNIVGDPTAVYAAEITTSGLHTLTTANTYKAYTYDHFNGVSGHDISKIFDGNDTTYWQAGYHEAGEAAQIIIDRGANPNPFNRVDIVFKTHNTRRISIYGAGDIADKNGKKDTSESSATYRQWTKATLPATSGTIANNIVLDNLSEPNDAHEVYTNDTYKLEATSGNSKTLTMEFNTCTKRYVMIENEFYMDHDQEDEYQLAIAEIKFYFDVPDFSDFGNVSILRNADTSNASYKNEVLRSYGLSNTYPGGNIGGDPGFDSSGMYVQNWDKDWFIYPHARENQNSAYRVTDEYFMEWRIADIAYGTNNSGVAAGDSVKTPPTVDPKTGKIKIPKNYWGSFNLYVKNTVTNEEIRLFMRISQGNNSSGNLARGKKAWNDISWNRYHDLSGNGSIKENGTVIEPYTLVDGKPKTYDYESSASIKYAVDGITQYGSSSSPGAYVNNDRKMKVYTMGSHGGASGPIIKINDGSTTNKTPYNYYTFYLGKSRSFDGFYIQTANALNGNEPSATGSSSVAMVPVSQGRFVSDEYPHNTNGAQNTLYSQSSGSSGDKAHVIEHYMPFPTRTDTYVQPVVSLPSTNTGALNQIVETIVEYYPPSRIRLKDPVNLAFSYTENGTSKTPTTFMGSGFTKNAGITVRNSDRVVSDTNDIMYYIPEDYKEQPSFNFSDKEEGWMPKIKIEVNDIRGGFNASSNPYCSRLLVNSDRSQVDKTMLSQLKWYLGESEADFNNNGGVVNGVKLERSSDGSYVTLKFTEDCVPHTLKLTCYWQEYGFPKVQQTMEIPVKYTATGNRVPPNLNASFDKYYTFEGFGGHSIMNGVNGIGSDYTLSSDSGWASNTWSWGDHGACTGTIYLKRATGFNLNKTKVDMARYNTKSITIHGSAPTGVNSQNYKLPDFNNVPTWRPFYQEATNSNGDYIYMKYKPNFTYYVHNGAGLEPTKYVCKAGPTYSAKNIETGATVTVKEGDYIDLNGNYVPPSHAGKVRYLTAVNWTGGMNSTTGVASGTFTGDTGYEARHEVANDGNRTGDYTFLCRLPGTKQLVNYLGGKTFYGMQITKDDAHPDYQGSGALPYSTHRLTNGTYAEQKINIPHQRLGGEQGVYALMYESGADNLKNIKIPGQSGTFSSSHSASLIWEIDLYMTYPRSGSIFGMPKEYKLGYYPENTIDLSVDLYDIEGDKIVDKYPYQDNAKWSLEQYNESTGKWETYVPKTASDPELKLLSTYGKTNTIQFRYAEAGKFRIVVNSTAGVKKFPIYQEFTLQNPSAYQVDAWAYEANINGPLPVELVIPQPGGTVSYEPTIALSAEKSDGTPIANGEQFVYYISHLFARADWHLEGENLRDITINNETGLVTIGPDAVAGEFDICFQVAKPTSDGEILTGYKTIKLVKNNANEDNYDLEAHFDIAENGIKLTKPKDIEIEEGNFGIGDFSHYNYFTPDYSTFDNGMEDMANGGFTTLKWSTTSDEIELDPDTGRVGVPANSSSRYFPVTLTGTKRIYTMNIPGAPSNNNDNIMDRNDGFTDIKVTQLYWVQAGEPFTVLDQAGNELGTDANTIASGAQTLTITNNNANTEGYAIAALYEYINGAPKLIEAKSVKATDKAEMTLTIPDRAGKFEVKAYQILTGEYYGENKPTIHPYSSPRAYPITHN